MRFFSCFTWLIALIGPSLAAHAQSNDWAFAKESEGVKVYTRSVPGLTLKAYRAVTTYEATAEAILAEITDADQCCAWQDRCTEGKLIRRIDENRYIGYTRIEIPWPLDDRDLVVKVEVQRQGDRIVCLMQNAPDAYPRQEGVVRMPRFEGRWELIPLPNGQTKVINEGITSPGGDIPDWLANSGVVDTPLATLINLRGEVEG